ncbi:MAG TPA: hypothetical protein VG777_08285 [Thermoanaerobaculia bacterium]|nr:hypothetical protein [Thermoanaerobaculia bacterium]
MSLTEKIVGRRVQGGDPVREAKTLQHTMIELRGSRLVPRGVYRFRTHQEADEWMSREIVNTLVRRKSRT